MEWIETKKQMPKNIEPVMVWIPALGNIAHGFTHNGTWYYVGQSSRIKNTVSHWMPLPEPPTK